MNQTLKELVWEDHKKAETRPFVKILFSGNIHPKLYATYLKNLHPSYEILEVHAMQLGLIPDIQLRRSPAILSDFIELWGIENMEQPPAITKTTNQYLSYVLSIGHDPKRLLAHMYVRHMGDLSGGQMIKKRIPGSAKFYDFGDEANIERLKGLIRDKIDDSLAEEAKVCFDFAGRLFDDMLEISKNYEPSLGNAD